MNNNNKVILVTGGAGFIGSHTCLVLLENGYKVCVIDSFETSSPKSLKRVLEISRLKNQRAFLKIFKGSLCDRKFINDVFSYIYNFHQKIDGIIHFAGLKAVQESIFNPISYWKNNLQGSINLIDVMNEYGCLNLVFSSSATIYQNRDNDLLSEDSDLGPINPYGNTKLCIEMLLKDLFKSKKKYWNFASLRYFNPIGAHESGLIGENPIDVPNNIFPLISNTALGLQKVFRIYGKDWPTADGTPIRDYIHIMDLAEAHLRILEYLISNPSEYLNINIGTGKGTSVLELIQIFERVNNIKVNYIFSERREGDSAYSVADNSLLVSKFNFSIKRNVEEMCRDGWKWRTNNPNGY